MSEVPTVWILGAGFSRSLGGPLFDDLLSMRAYTQYRASVSGPNSSALRQSIALYHFGRAFPEGYLFNHQTPKARGALWWSNAEEFLEDLENFREPPAQDYRWLALKDALPLDELKVGADFDPKKARAATAHFVSWQCDFIRRNRPESDDAWERASAYRAWGALLTSNDTVVTFNYDVAVEDLACRKIAVHLPESIQDKEGPELLKLHGSVDWNIDETDGQITRMGKLAPSPMIATPGNTKLSLRRGRLRKIWDRAASKIEQAARIHWLGYSLPESDASAVDMLLKAILRNRRNDLVIDLVLGPTDFRTSRLERILRQTLDERIDEDVEHRLAHVRRINDEHRKELEALQTASGADGETLFKGSATRMMSGTGGFGLAARVRRENSRVRVLPLFAQDYLRTFSLAAEGQKQKASAEAMLQEAEAESTNLNDLITKEHLRRLR